MAYILVVLLVAEARSALIQFSGSSLVAHFSSVIRMHDGEFVSGLG